MDQHDVNRGTAHPPAKDFLALTHGQEWVNFYESFDKLVQDHLSRSSELLRKAMALPEVADREVAQVRAEMEGKLVAERERSRDLLAKLRDEITISHDQVSKLAEDVNGVVADLASLSSRVTDALARFEKPAEVQTAPVAPFAAAAHEMPTLNGTVEAVDAAAFVADTPFVAGESEAVAEPTFEAPAEDVSAAEPESAQPPAAEVELAAADVDTELSTEAEAPASAESLDETPLDLSAMAEAESGAQELEAEAKPEEESGTGDLSEPAAVGGERPRPHWLSVTRIGSR
jgi:uncharacterized membrane protein